MPKPGDVFNPYRMFTGAWVPEALLKSRTVSRGAALCYGVLGRHAGQNGVCFPRQEKLAADMACDKRTVRRRIAELVRLKLIRTVSNAAGRHQTVNSYEFLWNSLLESGQLSIANRTEMSSTKRTKMSSSTGPVLISEESHLERESDGEPGTANAPNSGTVEKGRPVSLPRGTNTRPRAPDRLPDAARPVAQDALEGLGPGDTARSGNTSLKTQNLRFQIDQLARFMTESLKRVENKRSDE